MMINWAAATATAKARRSPEQPSLCSCGLADLVDSFYLGEEDEEEMEEEEEEDKGTGWSALQAALEESEADSVASRIRAEAERAVAAVGFGQGGDESKIRVVGWLRDRGFDAGLCTSAWERSADGAVTVAGSHDFIDVIHLGGRGRRRYILEIDFAAEFAIPRPSAAYAALLRRIPSAFVGTEVTVGHVVSVMCAAMRESMKSAGMPLPPWRRKEYVEAKWLSACVRRRADWEGGEARKEEKKKKKAWVIEGCREAEVRRWRGKLAAGQKENMIFS